MPTLFAHALRPRAYRTLSILPTERAHLPVRLLLRAQSTFSAQGEMKPTLEYSIDDFQKVRHACMTIGASPAICPHVRPRP
eukprot:3233048-Pleurochrysis_carterae.AAC.1